MYQPKISLLTMRTRQGLAPTTLWMGLMWGNLLACGVGESNATIEQPHASQQQALGQADLLTYSQGLLGWQQGNPFQCQGPWRYPAYNCYQERNDPACGVAHYAQEKHVVWSRCSHPDFGISGYTDSQSHRIEIHTSVLEIQTHSSDGTLEGANRYIVEKCEREHGNDILASMPAGSRKSCQDVSLLTPRVRNNEPLRWSVHLKFMAPSYHEVEDPRCGEDQAKTHYVTNHNKVESYASCRHSSFGLTQTDECGNGIIIRYGAAGSHYKALEGLIKDVTEEEIATYCMTCDGVPTEPAASKFHCLQNNFEIVLGLEQLDAGSDVVIDLATNKRLQEALAERMLLLDMFYSHQLTSSQQEKALEMGCLFPALKERLAQRRHDELQEL